LVTTILANECNDAIVRSTIDLACNLKLRADAEGVEDERTWRRVGQLGCDAGQGYHLSRPLLASEFASWLWQHQHHKITGVRPLRRVAR
jgi:diguanylate cyclase